MIAPARVAAYDALIAAEQRTVTLAEALEKHRRTLANRRDQALTTEIAVGSVRWQGALDFLIARVTGRPVLRLDVEVLVILRLSAYQLVHLDRVPVAAIVNDAVELTRRAGKESATGLVNASLRALARRRDAQALPPRPRGDERAPEFQEKALDYLGTSLSHPRWLARRWLDRLGFETAEAWATFDNHSAPLMLRVNRLMTDRDTVIATLAAEGVRVEPARFAPDGLVSIEGSPLTTSLAATGAFVAQDEASQLVARLVQPAPGELVLDACAAPGGKTTAIAAARGDDGTVVAMDLRPRRLRLLRRTVRRSGSRSIRLVRADVTASLPLCRRIDWALLDAPCSGLGTIRRDPEIRWRRREGELAGLAAIQGRMLARVADVIRPGGCLVYATCSSEPDENERVVERFLATDPRFRLTDPAGGATELLPFVDEEGYFRTSPVAHRLDAFFGAVLRRDGAP